MKKIITLCLFVFAMLIGNQSVVAQNNKLPNKIEVNTIASEKTEALRKFIKFSDSQRDSVYQAMREYTQADLTIKNQNNKTEGEVKKDSLKYFFIIISIASAIVFHLIE
jgi:hypothetical protein